MRPPGRALNRVATKIVLTFTVALAAFGLVAAVSIVRLHALGQDLRLLSAGWFPLGRIAAQLEVKDWVSSRALEARADHPSALEAMAQMGILDVPEYLLHRPTQRR